jgi:MYXO-CTERM domain-containing protein
MAVVANAAYVTPSVSFLSTQIVDYNDTSTTVDVYTITVTADDPEGHVGALLLCVGDTSDANFTVFDPGIGDNPFQAWGVGSKTTTLYKTATEEDAYGNLYGMEIIEGDTEYYADTHLLTGVGDWTPSTAGPDEMNDKSIAGPVKYEYVFGQGMMWFQSAVPVVNWANSIDVAQVGVIRGTDVYLRDMSSDGVGSDDTTMLIPEPATLTLLGLGALTLIRRRRS